MSIFIYSDSSTINNKSRGAYVILEKNSNAKLLSRIIKRTPIVNTNNSTMMEMLTACQAMIHALKEYPNAVNFNIYSDSKYVVDKFKMKWYELVSPDCDKYFKRLVKYIENNPRKIFPKIYSHHIRAHSGTLKEEAQKYNFMVDVLCSIKSN